MSTLMQRCPICRESNNFRTLVRRDGVPVFQNYLYREEAPARAAPTGEIHLAICESCGFVRNAAFDEDCIRYGDNYENDQSFSGVFLAHMDAMADRILAALPRDGTLVDVGCGQGNFLVHLARRLRDQQPKLYGFDPAYRPVTVAEPVSISARFFDRALAVQLGMRPDVLLARHVIEHIPDPVSFLSAMREAGAGASVPVRLFLETPCFEWIAANRVLQDVFYEHVNYFTANTLAKALRQAGFEPVKVDHVFDGQYLWAEAMALSEPMSIPAAGMPATAAVDVAADFADQLSTQLDFWRRFISDGVPTAVWGAGAKGITFASVLDPERKYIDCLIDSNPRKQGAFVPVTAHPIVSSRDGADRKIGRILIMNPNYRTEIEREVARLEWPAQLVDAGVGAA